jgi:hypothetical protein
MTKLNCFTDSLCERGNILGKRCDLLYRNSLSSFSSTTS